MKSEPVIVERTYNAPVNRVWDAITNVEKMRQWFFSTFTEFEPEVGFETLVNVSHQGRIIPHLLKVTEAVPQRKISYEWKFPGHEGESEVSFELFPEDDQTKIVVTHTGLETFKGEGNPGADKNGFVEGWTYSIGTALKNFVEQENEA